MRNVLRVVFAVLAAVVAVAALVMATYKPKSHPPSAEVVERTPARLARGAYLVNDVLGCMDCHSKHDLGRYGLPEIGPSGGGGECLGDGEGFPGHLCIPNITPDRETGLGTWSDGEIIRAVREGVSRDGRALFPMMPYSEYRALSDEDARAMVAYLRTLPAVNRASPATHLNFPFGFFIKMAPQPVDGAVADPDHGDRVAYGKYLAKVSGCQSCHTPVDAQHRPLPGEDFAGGQDFRGPFGAVRSANLTPHATGLGDRSEAAFVGLFKAFAVPAADLPKVTNGENTVMPWLSRARMTEADLGAIYAFLRTVPAIDRTIEKRPRPALPPPVATH